MRLRPPERRVGRRSGVARSFALLAALALAAPAAGEERRREISELDLDGLLDLSLGSASLHEERLSEAAAAAFVLDGEDLRRQGFRTLEEALRSVPGLFGYRDGHYGYIGVRGVGLLGDYTTRLLVLVDGHAVNDSLGIGASYLGRDLPVVLDAIRRIEVIKGPVGSVYGPTAFLGVVNVVTVEPAGPGGEIRTTVEAAQGRAVAAGAAAVATAASGELEVVAAAEGVTSRGQDWTFPELVAGTDRPAPAGGRVDGRDGWDQVTASLRAAQGGLRGAVACNRAREALPSGPYSAILLDDRTRLENGRCWLDAGYARALAPGLTLLGRGAFDWSGFRDAYAYAEPPEGVGLVRDVGYDRWWTGELRLEWEPDPRTRALAGATVEHHHTLQRSCSESVPTRLEDPDGVGVGPIRRDWASVNAYLLLERALGTSLRFHAGMTLFAHEVYGARATPKLAAVWAADPALTVKVVYAEGFRAPAASEAFFEDGTDFIANPGLRPETVRALEVSAERRLGRIASLTASLFSAWYRALVRMETVPAPGLDHPPDPAHPEDWRQQPRNLDSMRVAGGELTLNLRWRDWLWAYGGVSAQESEGDQVNFPAVTANLALSSRPVRSLTLAVNGAFAGRRAKPAELPAGARSSVPAAFVLGGHGRVELPGVKGLSLELGVTNLLDARAPSPVPGDFFPITEHPEPARTFRASLRWSAR